MDMLPWQVDPEPTRPPRPPSKQHTVLTLVLMSAFVVIAVFAVSCPTVASR